ncbi:MAG: hypothetical protein FWE65_00955 [Eggerthellaceae bacterium]|nr:hypothetical protein [Eggerthellaceae bacterium]
MTTNDTEPLDPIDLAQPQIPEAPIAPEPAFEPAPEFAAPPLFEPAADFVYKPMYEPAPLFEPEPAQTSPGFVPPPPPSPYEAQAAQPSPAAQAYPPYQAAPPQPYPPYPGVPPQAVPPQAPVPPQGFPPPPQAYPPYPGYPPQAAVPPQGYPPYPGMPPQGYQPQAGYQSPYGYPPPAYQSPYGYPGYAQSPPPKKKLVWPWVLGGCILLAILGLAGCVSCFNAILDQYDSDPYGWLDDPYYNEYYDYPYGSYTLDDLRYLVPNAQNKIVDGRATTGIYEVGKGKDLQPGLYYMEGSQTVEGEFFIFKLESNGMFSIYVNVVYFGNYYVELQEGDAIVFMAPDFATMYRAPSEPMKLSAPYKSGCYRVGIDIPAGSYTITYQSDAVDDAIGEAGAFIMKNMAWNDDSILEAYFVMKGGSHTITVKEGQYLELYQAQMVPAR